VTTRLPDTTLPFVGAVRDTATGAFWTVTAAPPEVFCRR
jgi:hypothetical protein